MEKNQRILQAINEGRRTKEYGLKIERQVLLWVSSMLMLKEMGLDLRSRNSFSHCVAFLILRLFLFSVPALPETSVFTVLASRQNMLASTAPGGGIKYNFKGQLLVQTDCGFKGPEIVPITL